MATRSLLPLAALILLADPAQAQEPDAIAGAIERLGDKRFAEREKASAELWAAGRKAEPALRKAARSSNPEVGRRAREILAKFDHGHFADSPQKVVDLIMRYRGGHPAIRTQAIRELAVLGEPGATAAYRLARSEPNLSLRHTLVGVLDQHTSILAFAFLSGNHDEDLAGLLYLLTSYHENVNRGRIQGLRGEARIEQLAREHFAEGRTAEALKLAAQFSRPWLKQEFMRCLGDWPALISAGSGDSDVEKLGYRIAFCRLSGRGDEERKAVDELKTWAAGKTQGDLGLAAEALLINERVDEAIELLRASQPLGAFQILSARGEYAAALALEPPTETSERLRLESEKAVLRARLGEKDQARRWFDQQSKEIWESGKLANLPLLIKALRQAGMTDEVHLECTRLLNRLPSDAELIAVNEGFPRLGLAACHLLRAWRRRNPEADWQAGFQLLERGPRARPLERGFALLVEDLLRADPGPQPISTRREVFRHLARLCEEAGQEALALQCHRARAIGTPPPGAGYDRSSVDGLWEAGNCLARDGKWEEAVDQYAVAFRESSNLISAWLLSRALEKTRRNQAANALRVWALRPLPVRPGNPDWRAVVERRELALMIARFGDVEQARRICWHLVAYSGAAGAPDALGRLSDLAAEEREYFKAADFLERTMLHFLETETALSGWRRNLEVSSKIHQYRAFGELNQANTPAALREMRQAMRLLPGNVETALDFIHRLDRIGRTREADEVFDLAYSHHGRICQTYPRAAGHHAEAARLAAGTRRKLEEAVEHARLAVRLEPSAGRYLGILAEAHFQKGSTEKAIEVARQCLELEPGDPVHRHRLDRYLRGGHD